MKNILWELFEGRYDITPNPSAEQQELWKKICVELDKVQGVFGDEWIDRLLELEGAQADRKSTRLNSSHSDTTRMPSSA